MTLLPQRSIFRKDIFRIQNIILFCLLLSQYLNFIVKVDSTSPHEDKYFTHIRTSLAIGKKPVSDRCAQFSRNFSLAKDITSPSFANDPLENPLALSTDVKLGGQYDYGRELLLYDIYTRTQNTSILEAPFYKDGHCIAPFSQKILHQLNELGLGITDDGLTVSCADVKDCEQCYRVTGCHWCQDNKCHAMGSFYGCIYGASCDGSVDPCIRKEPEYIGTGSISLSNTFFILSIGLISFLFIWFCLYIGLVCGLSSQDKTYYDGMLDQAILNSSTRYHLFESTSSSSNPSNRQIIPSTERSQIQNGDTNRIEFHRQNDNDSLTERLLNAQDSESQVSEPQVSEPIHIQPQTGYPQSSPLFSTRQVDFFSTSSSASSNGTATSRPANTSASTSTLNGVITKRDQDGGIQLYIAPPSALDTTLTPYSPTISVISPSLAQHRGMRRLISKNKCCSSLVNTIYNAFRCERYAMYKILVGLSAILCFTGVVIASIMYPKMPEYSICNKTVQWGSIFEYIINFKDSARLDLQFGLYNPNRFGLDIHQMNCDFKYKGIKIGKTKLKNISITPGTVQDIMLLTDISPTVATALDMADDYANGMYYISTSSLYFTSLLVNIIINFIKDRYFVFVVVLYLICFHSIISFPPHFTFVYP